MLLQSGQIFDIGGLFQQILQPQILVFDLFGQLLDFIVSDWLLPEQPLEYAISLLGNLPHSFVLVFEDELHSLAWQDSK